LIVRGANGDLGPADVARAEADLRGCDVLALQLEVSLATVYAAVELGVRLGLRVVLNPAPATAALDVARLRGIAYLVPNQTELALLSGLPVASIDDAIVAARGRIGRGTPSEGVPRRERVVVTLGADGVLSVDASDARHVPSLAVNAVDTTGAGDAFIGSFIHHLAAGCNLDAALDAGIAYAADSVTKRGTQSSYATRATFDEFRAARADAGAAR
jgi:ribokinase